MAKEHLLRSYITTSVTLLEQYDGSIPFNDFLKKYFAINKKYGSRDRKQISNLCYCYFRLSHSFTNIEIEESILLSFFFCSTQSSELLQQLKPTWNEAVNLSAKEKIALLNNPFCLSDIFPWQEELSKNIDGAAFAASHLIQPNLFLRIRPGYNESVIQKLKTNLIPCEILENNCIALQNNTNLEPIVQLNKEAVVQDYSSQRISEFITIMKFKDRQSTVLVWDCCAASGGKSILAADMIGNLKLTVSDVRKTILHNLEKRFKEAGIFRYKSLQLDLTQPVSELSRLEKQESFDLIICDAPCTSSGTWGRTPEQMHYFTKDKIGYYTNLQKKITANVITYIKEGGYFLYITCSVFRKENEEIIDFILAHSNLKLVKNDILEGYSKKADTMFTALFLSVNDSV